jgi:hypothetical protein
MLDLKSRVYTCCIKYNFARGKQNRCPEAELSATVKEAAEFVEELGDSQS